MLLYVMAEHPSVSQTFVVTEAATLRGLGMPVIGYALQHGAARVSAAPLDLICLPPSKSQLLIATLRFPGRAALACRDAAGHGYSASELARLLLAYAHAEYALVYARSAGITHIHAHFLGRTAEVARILAERLGCRWTVTSHGADAYAPTEPAALRARLLSAAGVACANTGVEAAVRARANGFPINTRIVHCGIDVTALGGTFQTINRRARQVLTIGRLVTTKGHWTVLNAADELLSRDESLCWTIIGDGPLRELLEADPRYQAHYPRLRLTGPMEHAAVVELLRGASAFVLPCEKDMRGGSDGIPVALMEAMALGVPVVTTDVGGISELVDDRSTGFLVTPQDTRSLVQTLEQILYAPSEAHIEEIREAARIKVAQDFNASIEGEKLLSYFQELVTS